MSRIVFFLLSGLILAGVAQAQEAGDAPKKPSMKELFRSSSLPKSHVDFSMFRYVPPGDKVQKQPDQTRLIFTTKDGQPDGYAQRRGSSIFYYDRTGHLSRIQPLTPEELQRLTQ